MTKALNVNGSKKVIGILGGMGPAASAQFHYELIQTCQKKFGAVEDLDFPDIIHYSLSLFGFDESGVCDETLVKSQLVKGVKFLEKAGVDFIVIPCNTVHLYYDFLVEKVSVPIINIAKSVGEKILDLGFKNVGLLASATTFKSNLYQKFLPENVSVCYPKEHFMPHVEDLIFQAMGGNFESETKNKIVDSIYEMGKNNDCVILGCTELPLGINDMDSDVPLLNSISILVEKSLAKVYC